MIKSIRIWLVCVLVLVVAAALAACGGEPAEPGDPKEPAASEEEMQVETPGDQEDQPEESVGPEAEDPGETGQAGETEGGAQVTDIVVPEDPTEGNGTPGAVGGGGGSTAGSGAGSGAAMAPDTSGEANSSSQAPSTETPSAAATDPADWAMPEETGYGADMTSFATLDLKGNTVTQAIFGDYEYTVVDVWGTYCGPCIAAMPGLAEIYNEYKDQGVNVMGLVIDVQTGNLSPNPGQVEAAWDIIEETGANFTHILVSANMMSPILNEVQYIPTSFIVDSEGNLVDGFHVGARSAEDWRSVLDGLLAQ